MLYCRGFCADRGGKFEIKFAFYNATLRQVNQGPFVSTAPSLNSTHSGTLCPNGVILHVLSVGIDSSFRFIRRLMNYSY